MKRLFCVLSLFCVVAVLSAQLQERMIKVNVVPNRVGWKYEPGQRVKFSIEVTKNRFFGECHGVV